MAIIIDTLLQFLDSVAKLWKSKVDNQTTTSVVKDKNQLKKASNITEEILQITDKYYNTFTKLDRIRYKRLKKRFLKAN